MNTPCPTFAQHRGPPHRFSRSFSNRGRSRQEALAPPRMSRRRNQTTQARGSQRPESHRTHHVLTTRTTVNKDKFEAGPLHAAAAHQPSGGVEGGWRDKNLGCKAKASALSQNGGGCSRPDFVSYFILLLCTVCCMCCFLHYTQTLNCCHFPFAYINTSFTFYSTCVTYLTYLLTCLFACLLTYLQGKTRGKARQDKATPTTPTATELIPTLVS